REAARAGARQTGRSGVHSGRRVRDLLVLAARPRSRRCRRAREAGLAPDGLPPLRDEGRAAAEPAAGPLAGPVAAAARMARISRSPRKGRNGSASEAASPE